MESDLFERMLGNAVIGSVTAVLMVACIAGFRWFRRRFTHWLDADLSTIYRRLTRWLRGSDDEKQ